MGPHGGVLGKVATVGQVGQMVEHPPSEVVARQQESLGSPPENHNTCREGTGKAAGEGAPPPPHGLECNGGGQMGRGGRGAGEKV